MKNEQMPPVVYIIDDDDASRDSLRMLLESTGTATVGAASPQEFFARFEPDRTACIVLDLRLPQMSGMEILRKIRAGGCATPVVLITGYASVAAAVEAMRAGAYDFFQKPVPEQELLESVQQCLRDHARLRELELRSAEAEARLKNLTPREREVLDHLSKGKRNKQIAHELQISVKTVEMHRFNLMRKTGASSITELIALSRIGGALPSRPGTTRPH